MESTHPPTTGDSSPASRLSAAERWLGSPIRLGLLAVGAAVLATVATTMGEIELREAAGFGEDEWRIVLLQGAHWLGWALSMPALIALAALISRSIRPWPLALSAHVPLALVVGSLFLGAEIKLQEWNQGPEMTRAIAERIEERKRRRAEGWQPSARDGRGGGRDWRGRTPEEGRREFDRASFDRMRQRLRGSTANVATGNFIEDFERRWLLRVPRYSLIYFALVGIGLGLRSFLTSRSQEREAIALRLRAGELESALAEARLAALKGQLHPHFLFNALHSVGGLIRSNDNATALRALSSIGDLLRTSLDAGGEQFVPLDRELELIERYVAVEALRLGDRLAVTVEVDDRLRPCEVPAFITQPLVENAIQHGIAARPEGGRLVVRVRAAEDARTMTIDIEDDGPGFTPNGRTGVGIRHVMERLVALFEDAASLEFTRMAEGGTRARLVLPLEDLEIDGEEAAA